MIYASANREVTVIWNANNQSYVVYNKGSFLDSSSSFAIVESYLGSDYTEVMI